MGKRLLALSVLLMAFVGTFAASIFDRTTFTVDDINYVITSEEEKTVSVTSGGNYVGDVVIPAGVVYNDEVYTVTGTDGYVFNQCSNLVTVELPKTIKTLGNYTFNQCTSLEQVNIPDGITTIPFGCFYGCMTLTSVTLPQSVTTIGKYAFGYASSLADVNITDNITSIGEAAFFGTAIKSVTIPSGVNEIADFAFSLCQKLTEVKLHEGMTALGNNAFAASVSLKSIKLPESLKSIGSSAFATCQSLEEIEIPDGVTAILDKCFYSCTSLKKAVLGRGVKSIGTDAFTKYKQVTDSLKLEELYLESETMVSGGANFADNLYNTTTVYVPEQLVDTYKADADWGKFNIEKMDEKAGISTTAIRKTDNNAWYNLNGTKAKSHDHGLFIHNGKTVVVK